MIHYMQIYFQKDPKTLEIMQTGSWACVKSSFMELSWEQEVPFLNSPFCAFPSMEFQSTHCSQSSFLFLEACPFSCATHTCQAGPLFPLPGLRQAVLFHFSGFLRPSLQLLSSSAPFCLLWSWLPFESHSIASSFTKFSTTSLSSSLRHHGLVDGSFTAKALGCLLARFLWPEIVDILTQKDFGLFLTQNMHT